MSQCDGGSPGFWKTLLYIVAGLVCPAVVSTAGNGIRPHLPPPDGLVLVHDAPSPEADLTRQVLVEAGFHPEYVPSGKRSCFVPEAEAREAQAFLSEYFAGSSREE